MGGLARAFDATRVSGATRREVLHLYAYLKSTAMQFYGPQQCWALDKMLSAGDCFEPEVLLGRSMLHGQRFILALMCDIHASAVGWPDADSKNE